MSYLIEFTGIFCPDGVEIVKTSPALKNPPDKKDGDEAPPLYRGLLDMTPEELSATMARGEVPLPDGVEIVKTSPALKNPPDKKDGDEAPPLYRGLLEMTPEELSATMARGEVPLLQGSWPFSPLPGQPPMPRLPPGPMLGYRTNRTREYARTLGDLKDLIVTKFMSCRPADETPDDLIGFAWDYGLPSWSTDDVSVEIRSLEAWKQILIGMTQWYSDGDPKAWELLSRDHSFSDLRPILAVPKGKKNPELIMTVHNLRAFMLLELGSIMAAGARITRCAQCGAYFATGKGTGRRDTALYDTNRCRVNAQRAAARAAAEARGVTYLGPNERKRRKKRFGTKGKSF